MLTRINQKSAACLLLGFFLLFVQPRQAQAFAPAIIPAAAIGALIVAAGAWSISKPVTVPDGWNAPAQITSDYHTLVRTVIATAPQVTQYGVSQIQGGYAAYKADVNYLISTFQTDLNNFMNKYGQMGAYLFKSGAPQPQIDTPMPNGTTFQGVGAHVWKTTGRYTTGDSAGTFYPPQPAYTVQEYGSWVRVWNTPNGNYNSSFAYYVTPGTPYTMPKGVAEIYNSTVPAGVLPSVVTDDFDKMTADNAPGFGVTLIDAGSAAPEEAKNSAPLVLPGAPTVDNPLDTSVPTVTPTTGSTAANDNATAANQKVTAAAAPLAEATKAETHAKAALDAYVLAHPDATYESDPTLAALTDALTTAHATTLTKAADYQAAKTAAAQAEVEANAKYPNASVETIHSFKWDSLKKLAGLMGTVWPFSLLSNLSAVYFNLTADPIPPVFDLPMVLGPNLHVDLAVFDPLAKTCRYLVSVMLSGGIVFYLVRFWRGVS